MDEDEDELEVDERLAEEVTVLVEAVLQIAGKIAAAVLDAVVALMLAPILPFLCFSIVNIDNHSFSIHVVM